jgi:hypothetical protein
VLAPSAAEQQQLLLRRARVEPKPSCLGEIVARRVSRAGPLLQQHESPINIRAKRSQFHQQQQQRPPTHMIGLRRMDLEDKCRFTTAAASSLDVDAKARANRSVDVHVVVDYLRDAYDC